MTPIFVDTGAWFARFVPSDPDHPAAREWFERNTLPLLTTDYVVDEDVAAAWRVFSGHRDKGWSFTDCVSRVVMERLSITTAAAFDEHFRQFGTVVVVP